MPPSDFSIDSDDANLEALRLLASFLQPTHEASYRLLNPIQPRQQIRDEPPQQRGPKAQPIPAGAIEYRNDWSGNCRPPSTVGAAVSEPQSKHPHQHPRTPFFGGISRRLPFRGPGPVQSGPTVSTRLGLCQGIQSRPPSLPVRSLSSPMVRTQPYVRCSNDMGPNRLNPTSCRIATPGLHGPHRLPPPTGWIDVGDSRLPS